MTESRTVRTLEDWLGQPTMSCTSSEPAPRSLRWLYRHPDARRVDDRAWECPYCGASWVVS